ncbi:MAG: DinB family protein [Chloroflexota bacterium]|nr:DinB family protein [Chloroflexota bacterium]
MPETIAQLRENLDSARAHLNTVLDAATDHPDAQVYSDGLQWNVRQIAVHLSDADRGHNNQIMAFAEGRDIIPEDFDIERYNKRVTEKRAEMTLAEARAALHESRAALNAWLDTLDESTLDKTGRHASLRILSIREVLQWMALHERQHADDISSALKITA